MKYLLQKGFRGFGDRLEHLFYCIRIALEMKRKIYVDWNDHYWNHNGENFYTYFELLDVGVSKIENLENLSIYPKFWKEIINKPLVQGDFYTKSRKSCSVNRINFILKKFPTEDVIVYPASTRGRPENLEFIANVFRVKDSRIINRINELNQHFNLSTCIGVHLRGTDRRRENHFFDSFLTKFRVMVNHTLKNAQIICVTDDVEYFNKFKQEFPRAVLLTKLIVTRKNNGSHVIPAEDLEFSKDELNVDLIVDFFTLASCKISFSTREDSCFHNNAVKLRPYVKTILGNG